ncbi:3,4-dihydroxy-2-butanone-4-phosphate synthase, partial [Francisella tularensis]|uniref:3,4-dihydroxy-2-butanone-4-phosphate synthase n=1 Tax=Francisella tularensis TaxID=263 RepID=UPI00168136FB
LVIKWNNEESVDLMSISGCNGARLLCELKTKDDTIMNAAELYGFAKKQVLPLLTTAELFQYRLVTEIFVTKMSSSTLPFNKIDVLYMCEYIDN